MKKETAAQIVILVAVIFYTQYYHLNNLCYRIWDESRLATSAYEMVKNGNIIVPTFEGKPDMWNTKPPLMIWAQALAIRFHGLTELSVRLPSAICGTITCLIIFLFLHYLTQNGWIALLSVVMLCTFHGYIGYHGLRNGEYDCMLTLFTTSYLLSIFLYCQADNSKRNLFLLLFFVSISLGVLTKSVAALLFLPSVAIYVLFSVEIKKILINKCFYLGIGIMLLMIVGFYAIREYYTTGYLQAVYDNELSGRFLKTNEEHNEPFFFYFSNFYKYRLKVWLCFFPCAAVFLSFKSTKRIKNAMWFILLNSISFLLVISCSKTKLLWYDLPVYPLLAILLSLGVFNFLSWISVKLPNVNKSLVAVTICFLVTFYPVHKTYDMIKWEGDYGTSFDDYSASYYLRDVARSGSDFHNYIYFYDEYCPQFKLYIMRMNDMGMNINLVQFTNDNSFPNNTKVIAHHKSTKQYIESNYEYEVDEEVRNVRVYLIKRIKT